MAKQILAVSTRHRNSNVRIVSTNQDHLKNKCSVSSDFTSFSSPELNLLIGLAFAAILAEGGHVECCRYEFSIFIDYRDALHDPNKIDILITVISHVLESGFLAFKKLGFPYYYDDFIWAYHQILNSLGAIPVGIKNEMQRILDLML